MKIKPTHFLTLEKAMTQAMLRFPNSYQEYQDRGFSEKRWRWDLFWYCSKHILPTLFLMDEVYPYANDDHIDTALRKITKTK